jgi:hypothetical protein
MLKVSADGGIAASLAVNMLALPPAGPLVMMAFTHAAPLTHTETDTTLVGAKPQTFDCCGSAWSTIRSLCVVAHLNA